MFKYLSKTIQNFIRQIIRLLTGKSSDVVIYKVLAVTPGGMKSWVDSSVGIIKKPNNSIPDKLLAEAGGYNRDHYLRFISNK